MDTALQSNRIGENAVSNDLGEEGFSTITKAKRIMRGSLAITSLERSLPIVKEGAKSWRQFDRLPITQKKENKKFPIDHSNLVG
jgi:hypothetical protein